MLTSWAWPMRRPQWPRDLEHTWHRWVHLKDAIHCKIGETNVFKYKCCWKHDLVSLYKLLVCVCVCACSLWWGRWWRTRQRSVSRRHGTSWSAASKCSTTETLAPTTGWVLLISLYRLCRASVSTNQHVSFKCFMMVSVTNNVLFQYEIAIVTADGVEIIGPLSSETNWDIAHMVRWASSGRLLTLYLPTEPDALKGEHCVVSPWFYSNSRIDNTVFDNIHNHLLTSDIKA